MMRRFGRRRRGGARSGGGATPIDAASVLQRILELEIVPAASLERYEADEVPPEVAAVGTGESKNGGRIVVAFSARDARYAALAALAVGGRLADAESFDGDVYAIAPEWTGPARRLLGLTGKLPFRLNAVPAPVLAENGAVVAPEPAATGSALTPAQIAGHLAGPADRDLFLRAARSLEGLAAKHGGALRGTGRAVEFVLLARRVAELRVEDGGVALTTLLPQRSTAKLTPETLAGSLDAFEGQLRKRLNDRRAREGEEGLRARAIAEFRAWHSLRALVPWPLGGSDQEVIDWVGVDVEGRPVIGAAREQLGLEQLATILEGALALQASLPAVLAHAAAPVVLDSPRLVLGAVSISPGVARVLDALALSHELFEIRGGVELELRSIGAGEAPSPQRARRRPPRRRDAAPRTEADVAEADSAEPVQPESGEARAEESEGGPGRSRGRRGRGRGRRGRGRGENGGREDGAGAPASSSDGSAADERPAPRFEEISLFDLDDEPPERDGGGRGRSRRGRGRRRSRGGSGDEAGNGDGGDEGSAPGAEAPGEPGPQTDESSEPEEDLLSLEEEELELADVPEFEPPVAVYEDEEEIAAEAEVAAKPGGVDKIAEVVPEEPRLPRRRSAIVAHADRDSIAAAVLIARDIRMVEGLWIYPQAELMSFFRGVATDLRDDTPIYVVGFMPKPAVEVLQSATLYRDRLQWFDHHDWPPEDLQALRDTIGEEAVHLTPGTGSVLPGVLECCSRRSRFTDKLVDLIAGRFSEHDYERWGRVWWWRLGELAGKTGDHRADVEGLLSGRPSDLAREASRAETPPVPAEVAYVSQRDFRLVHFAGYGLVVLEVPPELDLHLAARVVRERYGASLSLARRPDSEDLVFAGDELVGRRSLDLGGLVDHVANKLEWVQRLADADHVARIRVRQLATHPERLDEIVAEIAMGRSILER